MEQDEYRDIVMSLVMKLIGSFIVAAICFYFSAINKIKFDVITSAFLGFALFFAIGGKIFPESSKFISRRARNYRRAKRGLPPLDIDDEPTAEIITDFQRKG